MKAWLIYRKKDAQDNKAYIDWFIDEARKQAVDLQLIIREKLSIGIVRQKQVLYYNHQQQKNPNFVIVRAIESLLQVHFENMGIPTFNNSIVSLLCNNKARTYSEISQLNIPIPSTYFLSKQALPDTPPLHYPFVLKETSGRGGSGVSLITNHTEWKETIQNKVRDDVVIQSTNNIQLGKDVRVFVIGKEIIASVLRHNTNDFRANYTLGGTASLFTLTPGMRTMVQKIINHVDFGMVGIDFLLDENDQLLFNEIEDVVGSRILSKTTDINLLEKYIHFIINRLKQHEQPLH